MKPGMVIPLFKNNDNYIFSNYISIYLLRQFSKLLLKLSHTRLDALTEKHNI